MCSTYNFVEFLFDFRDPMPYVYAGDFQNFNFLINEYYYSIMILLYYYKQELYRFFFFFL